MNGKEPTERCAGLGGVLLQETGPDGRAGPSFNSRRACPRRAPAISCAAPAHIAETNPPELGDTLDAADPAVGSNDLVQTGRTRG